MTARPRSSTAPESPPSTTPSRMLPASRSSSTRCSESVRLRTCRATAWPVVGLVSRVKSDPLKRLDLELGDDAAELGGRSRSRSPEPTQVQRARVDTEVRALADEVSARLGAPWARPCSAPRSPGSTCSATASTPRSPPPTSAPPSCRAGPRVVRVLQWLLLLAAVAGLAWTIVLAVGGSSRTRHPPGGRGRGRAAPARRWTGARHPARAGRRALRAPQRAPPGRGRPTSGCVRRVDEVARELVIDPVRQELAAYDAVRAGISRALNDPA